MAKAKVENIVASTRLADSLDLTAIAIALEGAEYEPEQFPGLIYRLKEPKTALLLFRSGKVNCTGGKSMDDVRKSIDIVIDLLDKVGIPIIKSPEIEIQNMVAVYDLGCELNLTAIAMSLGLEGVEYEPEQFPGLVYRFKDPKVVTLLFGSGKIVLTGAKRTEDLDLAIETLKEDLKAAGLLN
jgi:transcription initiation factor TFIID TATA-box-binding protein